MIESDITTGSIGVSMVWVGPVLVGTGDRTIGPGSQFPKLWTRPEVPGTGKMKIKSKAHQLFGRQRCTMEPVPLVHINNHSQSHNYLQHYIPNRTLFSSCPLVSSCLKCIREGLAHTKNISYRGVTISVTQRLVIPLAQQNNQNSERDKDRFSLPIRQNSKYHRCSQNTVKLLTPLHNNQKPFPIFKPLFFFPFPVQSNLPIKEREKKMRTCLLSFS